MATPLLVQRFGLRTAAIIGISVLPVEGFAFCIFALMPGLPVLPLFVAIVALLSFGTSIYTSAVNNSRFRGVSKAQAGTDYSLQSSLWNFGIWLAGSLSGFVAAAVGWAAFFPLAAGLTFAFGLFYVLKFDLIKAMVRAREREELTQSAS